MLINRRQFIATSTALLSSFPTLRALAQESDLTSLTIAEAGRLIRAGELSATELTQAYLDRIRLHDGKINAYITVTEREALRTARQLDNELSRGRWRGPIQLSV